MEQIFIKELKGNFNLRRPKSTKPTPIYYVVYMDGIQHYFATGVKVYPSQWDKKKQIAVVSNTQSKLDNLNNGIVNRSASSPCQSSTSRSVPMPLKRTATRA